MSYHHLTISERENILLLLHNNAVEGKFGEGKRKIWPFPNLCPSKKL
jgi:hypothetical protein